MLPLYLQLFADEQGTGSSGSIGVDAAPTGQNSMGNPNATPAQDAAVDFDGMLKSNPQFKAEYDARVKKALDGRYKEYADLQQKSENAKPMFAMLAEKYGVRAGEDGSYDQEAIMQAIMDDDSFYEEEAMEKGLTVAQLKEIRAMERENESLRQQVQATRQEEEDREFFSGLVQQGEALKNYYPGFDIQAEMANPQFARLVMNGVPVKGAFEAVHMDEIMGGAMQYAAQQVTAKVSNAYAANQARPRENGATGGLPSSSEFDPTKLTKDQRKELRERAYRGERISF